MVEFFIDAYKDASVTRIVLEFLVFVCGIASVVYARKENILVYPTGLVATVISTYLLWMAGYLGDMMINLYFSVMSVYGWWNWSRKRNNQDSLPISRTNFKEKIIGIALFFATIIVVFAIYRFFDYEIKKENYVDIVASGIFFAAMWYMAHKKIENWTLWIIGDLIVTPIYAYRGLGMLSVQYLIFTVLAILAYLEWRRILQQKIV